MIEGVLDQIGAAVDPVHDLQRPAFAGVLGGAVTQPHPERRGLLDVAQAQQRVDGERTVPNPGVAVVPVPLAALLLGQPGGRRGDQRAGRGVGHQLERHGRAGDHLPPPSLVGRPGQPRAPEPGGIVGQPLRLLRGHPPRLAAHPLQHHAAGLPLAQRPGPSHPVAVPLDRDARVLDRHPVRCDGIRRQGHAIGLEDAAVLVVLDLVRGAAVVEARLEFDGEPHRAPDHPDVPHQVMAVGYPAPGDRHEVVYLTDPVRGHEPGDQDRGVRQVQLLAHVVVPVGLDREIAPAVGVEQRGEHAGGVEPGTAEPVHRPVLRDQRGRLQVADQTVVADVGIAGHCSLLTGAVLGDWVRP